MTGTRQRIMVVDDEQDICEILRFNLASVGYEVHVANSAEEALEALRAAPPHTFDLLLLDVMMSGMSGFDLANILKSKGTTADIPIIFLTAKDTSNDAITGLNIGADDYISKPFSLQEVMLRIKAVLRRTTPGDAPRRQGNVLAFETMAIDQDKKRVSIDGSEIPLTRTEYELLRLLVSERGRVLSRQELIERAWPDDVLVSDRTVDVNITRLRKKVGPYAAHIATRMGFGYLFEE